MGLDIRLPTVLMFTTLGLMLAGYGLIDDRPIYQRSLDINVNLWRRPVMLFFGVVMMLPGRLLRFALALTLSGPINI